VISSPLFTALVATTCRTLGGSKSTTRAPLGAVLAPIAIAVLTDDESPSAPPAAKLPGLQLQFSLRKLGAPEALRQTGVGSRGSNRARLGRPGAPREATGSSSIWARRSLPTGPQSHQFDDPRLYRRKGRLDLKRKGSVLSAERCVLPLPDPPRHQKNKPLQMAGEAS
jgi:hypothetical protein